MGSEVIDVGLRLHADGTVQTASGVKLTTDAVKDLGAKADAARKPMDGLGVSSGQTRQAMRQLPAQINDVVASLAGGQKPFMVAIQQGGQIADSFGGIAPAARALTAAVSPAALAVGALAVAGGGLAAAYYAGWKESRALTDGLALSGNTAAMTQGRFEALVSSLASLKQATVGDVREMLTVLATNGQQTSQTLEASARAAMSLARLNGQSAAENAKAFAGMSDSISDWAAKANKAYNFLTGEQYRHIQALQAQGRSSEAVQFTMNTLSGVLEERTAPALGLIEQAAKAARGALSGMVDSLLAVGRPETTEQLLKQAEALLENAKRRGLEQPQYNASTGRMMPGSEDQVREAQARVDRLRSQLQVEKEAADQKAKNAQKAAKEIEQSTRAYGDSRLSIESANNDKWLAEQNAAADREQQVAKRKFDALILDAVQYRDALNKIERDRLIDEESAAEEAVAIERRRKVTRPEEVNARTAAIAAAETKLIEVRRKMAALAAEQEDYSHNLQPRKIEDSPTGEFLKAERAALVEMNKAAEQRRFDALQGAHDLLQTNKGLSAGLIQDGRARAQALLAIEVEAMRQRMDLESGNDSDRRLKREAFDQWVVLRERQLAEDLKPEWQRMLEAWQDTQRLMRESSDAMYTNLLRGAEDAYATLLTTGQFNARALANIWITEMARADFRKFMGSVAGNGGGLSGLWSTVKGLFGGQSAVSNDASMATAATWFWHGGGTAGEPSFSRMVNTAAFAGAPRFHTGIGPGELPAVIKDDEGVFTKGQMRAMAPVSALKQASGGTRINFAPVIHIDARSDLAQVRQVVADGMRQAQRGLLEMMDRRQV